MSSDGGQELEVLEGEVISPARKKAQAVWDRIGWVDLAIDELERLDTPIERQDIVNKKQWTIIHMVDATVSGKPISTVFAKENTGSDVAYYKWKNDPLFADVYNNVLEMARMWKNRNALMRIAAAQKHLEMAAPAAAMLLIKQLGSPNPNVAQRAAIAILDRAARETADKSVSEIGIYPANGPQQLAALADMSDEEIERAARNLALASGRVASGTEQAEESGEQPE